MEQIEEPMDVDVAIGEVYKFDDLIDDNIKLNEAHERRFHHPEVVLENRYENKGGTFYTGIDIFSKEEKLKMEERAKRFGLVDKIKNPNSDMIEDLYASLGIDESNESTKNLRLNVVHMRGTEDMSTQDVFKYFERYGPASIEWINDVSCNVVWLDNISAARALKGLSKKIVGLNEGNKSHKPESKNSEHSNNVEDEDDVVVEITDEDDSAQKQDNISNENEINVKDINCPLPPGPWRKGVDYGKSKSIFLRFATRSDKKQLHAEKMSEYYKKYGNPNFGGERGLLSQSRKRLYKQMKSANKREKDLVNNGTDAHVKNPWGALSQNWGVHDSVENDFASRNPITKPASSVKVRLGVKNRTQDMSPQSVWSSKSESESESEEDWCKRSKNIRMRMHADDEEEKIQKKRIRNHDQRSPVGPPGDLRSKIIGKSKEKSEFRDAIQVVVINPGANKKNADKHDSEEEEGEIVDDYDEEQQDEEYDEQKGNDEDDEGGEQIESEEEVTDDNSHISEKEVQGPRGSVIKVVPRKPRLASTVWARLNNVKSVVNENTLKERYPTRRDLREPIKGPSNDLRSRLGKYVRGRSPLRIEVKNDKCAEDDSATD